MKMIAWLIVLLCLLVAAEYVRQPDSKIAILQTGEELTPLGTPIDEIRKICDVSVRRICRLASKQCIPVYVGSSETEFCKKYNAQKIEAACGSADAVLYASDTECLQPEIDAAQKENSACPESIDKIQKSDVMQLYKCKDLHQSLCAAACGVRYDGTDIRDFWQTPEGHLGLTCIDGSREEVKNGVSLAEDSIRKSCTEEHVAAGIRKWCIVYNRSVNGVDLGAYVQCVGRLQ